MKGVSNRLRHWVTATHTDPIPVTLTTAGLVMSVLAATAGVALDLKGFGLNVLGNLVLVGPALFLSNVIVKRVQAVRARTRIKPLLQMVLALLHYGVRTAQQTLDMLEVKASLDAPAPVAGGADHYAHAYLDPLTLGRVRAALADALAKLPSDEQVAKRSPELQIKTSFLFPLPSLVLRLIQQIDQVHPMPSTVTIAIVADQWGEQCGVDFYYDAGLPGPRICDRTVGLTQIRVMSSGVTQGTSVGTAGYVKLTRRCVDYCVMTVDSLASELPAALRE